MGLSTSVQISDQDVRTTQTSLIGLRLGQLGTSTDGKQYVLSANTSTSLTLIAGKMTQGAAPVANHINRTGVTYTAGTSVVSFAVGATLVSVDQYKQGYLVVNKGTGAGQHLLINGNTAAASSGSPTVSLKDPIITATLASDSKFSLYPNIYSACLIYAHASPNVTIPTGVPVITVPAATTALPNTYFWNQVGGQAAVLADAATWIGSFDGVIPSTLTDGAIGIQATATVQPSIGYTLDLAVSTEYHPTFLTIGA